nr:immunoglobulin heavy chain junction region [Macaca mulatta]MOV40198.1 immunoglobulin heavy chain junction region [Macaca mulatta]MOV40215.1 immunoglobulin heavy chain junction region [Macaca mulatta]MOV41148.1 immunoglobulin heavy chain junction region [Macaca mulatta]MOV42859.1 immunoglobulin heavy chain junction region [Macaca mulatta]
CVKDFYGGGLDSW